MIIKIKKNNRTSFLKERLGIGNIEEKDILDVLDITTIFAEPVMTF